MRDVRATEKSFNTKTLFFILYHTVRTQNGLSPLTKSVLYSFLLIKETSLNLQRACTLKTVKKI